MAKVLTEDEARRIASNIAKLPLLLANAAPCLGHSSPAITLSVYAHLLFSKTDAGAAAAIEKVLK